MAENTENKCCGSTIEEDKGAGYETIHIEKTTNVCPMCEDYATRYASRPIARTNRTGQNLATGKLCQHRVTCIHPKSKVYMGRIPLPWVDFGLMS